MTKNTKNFFTKRLPLQNVKKFFDGLLYFRNCFIMAQILSIFWIS